MLKLKWLLVAALVVIVGGGLWFTNSALPFASPGREVVVRVVAGDSVATVANKLEDAHVVASALAFRVDVAVFGSLLIQPGYYELHEHSSHADIRAILSSVPNAQAVTIFPGATIRQIARQMTTVEGARYAGSWQRLALGTAVPAFGSVNYEGLLGVGMYVIGPHEDPRALLARMEQRFVAQLAHLGITPSSTIHGLSAYRFVIATSIVEKEGYYATNMPKVARVILNRLQRGGGLQMDATVLYYLDKDGVKVTPGMLQLSTPYNTYKHAGLTPTPICQVSAVALRAMLHPPVGSWLYFVVVDKAGTEAFATTYAEHLRNVELARSRGL